MQYMKQIARFNSRVLFVALTFFLVPPLAASQVYKWVDENGKVHFSDEPPRKKNENAEMLDVGSGKTTPSSFPPVRQLTPIKFSGATSPKSVVLEQVALEFDGANVGDNPIVGKSFKYTNAAAASLRNTGRKYHAVTTALPCQGDGDLRLNHAQYIMTNVNFQLPFARVLQVNGYDSAVVQKKRFALQESAGVDLSMAAVVTDIQLAYCGMAHAPSLHARTQNSTYIKVKWEVFDNLSRRIVLRAESEGADHHIYSAPRQKGTLQSMELAFSQALENLLSQQAFINILTPEVDNMIAVASGNAEPITVGLRYGKRNASFADKIDMIKKSSATIRTTSGHGSGFVISRDGHVLTNHHVVANNREVLVFIDGREFYADFLRSDPERDVALLQLRANEPTSFLAMDKGTARLGETIYVVGTPLDERLHFSISRGIVSADRQFDQKRYYQTDAAVNPGNSGGPVFNDAGNVIGITVAGHFARDGGSKNVGYIIPIDDALEKLGIK